MEIQRKKQKEMSEVRNTVAETKNAFDGLIRRLGIAEERFSDLEDVSIEISKTERLKKKKKKRKDRGTTTKGVIYS